MMLVNVHKTLIISTNDKILNHIRRGMEVEASYEKSLHKTGTMK